MRVRIEAQPGELEEKRHELVHVLSRQLERFDPVLADALEKALPRPTPKLYVPSLRDLHTKTSQLYRETLDLILKDVGKVLDDAVRKAEEEPNPKTGLTPSEAREQAGEEPAEDEEEDIEDEEDEDLELSLTGISGPASTVKRRYPVQP